VALLVWFALQQQTYKEKLFLGLTEHHAMKTYWGSGGIAPRILTSALDEGEWSASRSGCFTSTERAPRTHWIGSCVGPRAVLDAVMKRKIPSPHRKSNPRTPIVQPVAQRYTDWAITALTRSRNLWIRLPIFLDMQKGKCSRMLTEFLWNSVTTRALLNPRGQTDPEERRGLETGSLNKSGGWKENDFVSMTTK
jgi:hypothetical protein